MAGIRGGQDCRGRSARPRSGRLGRPELPRGRRRDVIARSSAAPANGPSRLNCPWVSVRPTLTAASPTTRARYGLPFRRLPSAGRRTGRTPSGRSRSARQPVGRRPTAPGVEGLDLLRGEAAAARTVELGGPPVPPADSRCPLTGRAVLPGDPLTGFHRVASRAQRAGRGREGPPAARFEPG